MHLMGGDSSWALRGDLVRVHSSVAIVHGGGGGGGGGGVVVVWEGARNNNHKNKKKKVCFCWVFCRQIFYSTKYQKVSRNSF